MSGDLSGRRAGKVLANVRAVEEQAERTNPLKGKGATPSMGLSEVRGGAIIGAGKAKKGHSLMDHLEHPTEKFGGAKHLGKELMAHLKSLHGAGYAKEFKSGMESEEEGCGYSGAGMSGAGMSGAGLLGQPGHGRAVGAGMSGGEMSGCGVSGGEMDGAGFWDDFKQGFNMVARPLAGIAKAVVPGAAPVLGALGYGMAGGAMYPSGAYEGQGKLTIHHEGMGKPRRPNARAALVKRIMAERGVSMIDASKIIKAEGLH